ncbi:M3 family metallopeptidase [Tellurirhabdus rosea]|uniref:M3 family metallopeptidase n=1 Tax=Tellurirhabdus rosea TaxID=2674997 RepID=UPI002B1CDD0A
MLSIQQLTSRALLLATVASAVPSVTVTAQPKASQTASQPQKMSENPLLQPYRTPHGTVPFNLIKNDHYLPALKEAIAQGKKEIDAIAGNTAKPTFENTIVALERAGEAVNKVTSVMFNLNSSETTPELQGIVREASPLLTEYSNDISLNEKLFARVKAVYEQRDKLKLDATDKMLLEKSYKGFARNGANLSEADKVKLREINKEMSQLSLKFGENVLNETNQFEMLITDEKELDGLPEFAREAARGAAKQKGKEGWLFTLQAPSYLPFMQYANNRELRKKLYLAYNSRGFQKNDNNNEQIIQRLVQLRYDRAKLLGYKTHADYMLEDRMAGSRDKVQQFLDEMLGYSKPVAEKQLADLTTYAKSQGFKAETLENWDFSYYAEKLKKERYSLDDEMLKPYFKLENVLDGIFTIANKLYGVTFKENKDIPVYNPEVRAFEVYDENGKFLAVFYGDYFPRAGKRAGAWMNGIRSQKIVNGEEVRPHVVNVCNFTRPTETKPSLLTFNEVTTLFHEFGHGLHGMLTKGKYSSLSGTSVAWDFVELPSQVMENWAYEPEALRLFAKHFQTGETIPQELIDKIRASQNFLAGIANVRQVKLGMIDMYWHSQQPTGESVADVEKKVDQKTALLPVPAGVATSPAFSHIFAGGYSSGYYSYKWSEVLDADAFEAFKEKGIFNKEVADKFRRNVLEKGGTEKPMELYKKFRGREPSPQAMLKRSGLVL